MGITNMADEEDTGPKYNYEGDLQEGDPTLQDGRGHATYANCDEYEGEYKDGMRHGHGTYKWAKTEPEEDNPDVLKEVLDEDGKKMFISEYTGQYVSNLKDGEGTFKYPDGSKYQGNWRHDKRHGDGVYWFKNGDIYSGEWRFGSKHGRGTFIHAETNARLVGTYADGKFVKGKWVMADATYTGGYQDNKPIGPGQFTFTSGNRQDGEYVQKVPAEGEEPEEGAGPLDPQWKAGNTTAVVQEKYIV